MAVRAPDPHNLRSMTEKAPAPIINVDRPCLGCGYNLRGLREGINCPECGLPSVMPEGIDDPLSVMPRGIILAFVWGCWTASICIVGVIAAVIARRTEALDPRVPAISLAGLSLLWLCATFLLTPSFSIPQAVVRGFSRAGKIRRATRLLQGGWVLAAGCAAGAASMSSPPPMIGGLLALGVWLGCLAGMAGLVLLCILMERLADWTRDEDAQRMFNWTMWGVPLVTPLLFFNFPFFIGTRFHLVVPIIWLVVVGMFPYGLLMLSKSVTLSIVHSFEHDERTARRKERRKKYFDHVGTLVEKMDKRPRH